MRTLTALAHAGGHAEAGGDALPVAVVAAVACAVLAAAAVAVLLLHRRGTGGGGERPGRGR